MTKAKEVEKMIKKFGKAEEFSGRTVTRARTECRMCSKTIFSDDPDVQLGEVEFVQTRGRGIFFFHSECYRREQRQIRAFRAFRAGDVTGFDDAEVLGGDPVD